MVIAVRKFRRIVAFVIAIALLDLHAASVMASEKKALIASGGKTGVYYPVALAICRLFNVRHSFHGYGCAVESTGGSIDNLRRIRRGEANFAIVQSDWQLHAYEGTDTFSESGPHEALRSTFSLYSESFTVLARRESKIFRFEDLRGRRVNIGNAGSGQRATMELLMATFGWNRFDFAAVREFGADEQAQALCDREVDAIVFVAGHPSGTIKSATQLCDTNFVEVSGATIEKLLEDNSYYRPTKIPTALYYQGESEEVATFGLSATMVTTSDTPGELVERMMSAVFTDIEKLRKLHPALTNLDTEKMSRSGMPAPLHDAAEAFHGSIVN